VAATRRGYPALVRQPGPRWQSGKSTTNRPVLLPTDWGSDRHGEVGGAVCDPLSGSFGNSLDSWRAWPGRGSAA